jgi:hypothetical protein
MMVTDIRENDVLLGRGGQTNKHEGNKRYRTMVTDHQNEYLQARKKDKVLIARRIVAIVRQHDGRFLKTNNFGVWEQVADKRAQEKTSQALREGLDVRNRGTTKMSRRDSNSTSTGSPPLKRAKMTMSMSPYSPSVVSVDGTNNNTTGMVMMPSHLQLHDSMSTYLVRPVAYLNYNRQLSKSDVTDACAV